MKPVRVALLNASFNADATHENFRRDVNADVCAFAANEDELPDGYDFDAAIVSGSGASVYDNEPWISALVEWVDGAVERDLPLLGVCFGHQLLAYALGGEVRDMGEYEIGYEQIERIGDQGILAGLPRRFLAFTTHSDEVARLPPGADLIAENDCSIQGFRCGDVFGVQFHPEYDRDTAEMVTRDKEFTTERKRTVLDSITDENAAAAASANTLFDNFVSYAADRAAGEQSVH